MIRSVSAAIAGRALTGYLRLLRVRGINWHFLEHGKLLSITDETACQIIDGLSSRRHLILPFWNAQSLVVLAAYVTSQRLRQSIQGFQAVADDSLGGEITQRVFRQVGLAVRQIRYRRERDRLTDIHSVIRDRPNLAMAVDSHGPYRSVGIAAARLSKSLSAAVVPVAALADRHFTIFSEIKMAVPLPGAKLTIALAPPIIPDDMAIRDLASQWNYALTTLSNQLNKTK